jgi:hypothetical protein
MKVLVVLLVVAVIVILIALGNGAIQNTSNRSLAAFGDLLVEFQKVFALTADFTVRLINDIYGLIPESLRCLMGLAIQATGLLSLIGLWSIWSGIRMWKRYL